VNEQDITKLVEAFRAKAKQEADEKSAKRAAEKAAKEAFDAEKWKQNQRLLPIIRSVFAGDGFSAEVEIVGKDIAVWYRAYGVYTKENGEHGFYSPYDVSLRIYFQDFGDDPSTLVRGGDMGGFLNEKLWGTAPLHETLIRFAEFQGTANAYGRYIVL